MPVLAIDRRTDEKNKGDKDKWVFTIPKQWVHLIHPRNNDQVCCSGLRTLLTVAVVSIVICLLQGNLELEFEVLRKEIAVTEEYKGL